MGTPGGFHLFSCENRTPISFRGSRRSRRYLRTRRLDIYARLNEIIPDNSIVLTHDLIFLPDYVKHNIAARRLADKKPGIRWIHTVHSATSPNTLIQERAIYGPQYKELLLSKFPNSIISYPNAQDIPRVAENFSYEQDQVVEIPHSTDPTEGMSRLVKGFMTKRNWEIPKF
jgi:hypothetical protein